MLALLAMPVAWGADAPPSAEEQQRFLAETREAALKYAQSLPDFICTQKIQRLIRASRGGWRRLDTLTVSVSSTSKGEEYTLVEINGAPTDRSYESLDGATTRGELGTLLAGVFDPQVAAEFRFMRWTTFNRRRAAIYSYRVRRENSRYQLQFVEPGTGETLGATTSLRGEVSIDRQTSGVLRIRAVAEEIPASFPLRSSSLSVTYGYTDVGGRSYLLPLEAVSEGSTVRQSNRNLTEFRDYRKFIADSTIRFGPEPRNTP